MDRIKGMIGVEDKKETRREARARGTIRLSSKAIKLIREGKIPKGDVLEQARVAGILAAKRVPEMIPLCHPIRITKVEISFEIKSNEIVCESDVIAVDRTGVEIEAIFACTTALITIYDMCKMIDREMTMKDVVLLEKKGGRSGYFKKG